MKKLKEIFNKASKTQKKIALGGMITLTLLTGGLIALPAESLDFPVKKTEPAAPAVTAAATAPSIEPIGKFLKTADAERGRLSAQPCAGCHSLDKDMPHSFGPNLWNIVNAPYADIGDFEYSPSLKSQKDKKWGNEELNRFLANPAQEVPGTTMPFIGIKDAQTRADIIAYLGTLSDKPAARPPAKASSLKK